jgi:hypothetical protein
LRCREMDDIWRTDLLSFCCLRLFSGDLGCYLVQSPISQMGKQGKRELDLGGRAQSGWTGVETLTASIAHSTCGFPDCDNRP